MTYVATNVRDPQTKRFRRIITGPEGVIAEVHRRGFAFVDDGIVPATLWINSADELAVSLGTERRFLTFKNPNWMISKLHDLDFEGKEFFEIGGIPTPDDALHRDMLMIGDFLWNQDFADDVFVSRWDERSDYKIEVGLYMAQSREIYTLPGHLKGPELLDEIVMTLMSSHRFFRRTNAMLKRRAALPKAA